MKRKVNLSKHTLRRMSERAIKKAKVELCVWFGKKQYVKQTRRKSLVFKYTLDELNVIFDEQHGLVLTTYYKGDKKEEMKWQ